MALKLKYRTFSGAKPEAEVAKLLWNVLRSLLFVWFESAMAKLGKGAC